ncbi:MAG: ribonuclease HII [Nitrospira sp.]
MEARSRGYRHIAGLDEAGRGPLAGPVVAAAVLLPRRCRLSGLNDSKQIVEADRIRLFGEIVRRATGVGIGAATEAEIDRLNILQASLLAMRRALMALPVQPDFLLLDAVTLSGLSIPQRPIIKGDGLSCSIAAASIVAKVTRDRLMVEYHRWYPQYNFAEHKGYATPEHLRLLREHGPCVIHRRSFAPVQHCFAEDETVTFSLCDESESLLD